MASTQKTVLIVDDSAMMRRIVAEVVESLGCRVVEAKDGYDALEAFEAQPPDLVILDVIMPGMNGFATLRQLRGRPGGDRLPVVMLTVEDSEEVMERAREERADGYLTKPIDLEELEEVVQRYAG